MLPGRTEFYAFAEERETRHGWLALPPDCVPPPLRDALDRAVPCLPLSDAMHTCAALSQEITAVDQPSDRPVLVAVANAAFALYLAEAACAVAAMESTHPAIRHACDVARQRAAEPIGVSDLARAVGLSPEHLARLFRHHLEMSPGTVLREERLRLGIQLLEHTGLPVADVAHRAGFATPQHFARLLRRATGMAPTALRSRSWATDDTGHVEKSISRP